MNIPSNTYDLINILKTKYPNKIEIDEKIVGTPEYWKRVGIITLLEELEFYITQKGGK